MGPNAGLRTKTQWPVRSTELGEDNKDDALRFFFLFLFTRLLVHHKRTPLGRARWNRCCQGKVWEKGCSFHTLKGMPPSQHPNPDALQTPVAEFLYS